jgi:KDO2-lipid IV(A) lauroyltransferase
MSPRRRFRQVGETALFLLGLAVIPPLPRFLVRGLASALGGLGFRLSRRDRAVALANLDAAYGQEKTAGEKTAIARESFRTFALLALDVFWFSFFTRARVLRWVRPDPSFEHFLNERPVIAVTGHMGNWEVMGQLGARLGRPASIVATPLQNPIVNRLLNWIRRQSRQEIVPRAGALKQLLRILRNQGRVALLMDQNTRPSEGGEFVDFFGLPVPVSRAAGVLSAKTGSRIVLVHCTVEPDGSYRTHAAPAFGGAGGDPSALTRKLAADMERVIRANPGAWLWSYKRWKLIPAGAPAERYPFYAKPLDEAPDAPVRRTPGESEAG